MFKTKEGKTIQVERIAWKDVSRKLMKLNPDLVKIINRMDVGDDLPIYKAKYPFGVNIISNAEGYLPLADGSTIGFNNPSLPKELSENLNYDTTIGSPLGILLNKNCELYMQIGQRIMPHMAMYPGEVFGINRALNNALPAYSHPSAGIASAIWDISSGARSIFMLSKIADNTGHNKIKKHLGCDIPKPESYQEHNQVFKIIANQIKNDWYSEVLFFSTKWIKKLGDPECLELFGYLSQVNRYLNRVWHNAPKWTAIFNEIEQDRRIAHYSSYAIGTARHLFNMAAGCVPGFIPAIGDGSAPVKLIQDIYLDVYELDDHWPVIMEPAQLSPGKTALYYSLNYPTLAQHNPTTFKGKSIISLEDDLKYVMERYCSSILVEAEAQSPSLYGVALNTEFSFFHTEPGGHSGIKNNQDIPKEDKNFECRHAANATFPVHSAFLKGCVRLSSNRKSK